LLVGGTQEYIFRSVYTRFTHEEEEVRASLLFILQQNFLPGFFFCGIFVFSLPVAFGSTT